MKKERQKTPMFYHNDECDCVECDARRQPGGLEFDPSNDDDEFEKHEEEIYNSMATCPSREELKKRAEKEPRMASEIKPIKKIRPGSIYKSEPKPKCPRCGVEGQPLLALSRRANRSICSKCGAEEATFDFKINQSRNMIGAEAFKEEIDATIASEKAWTKKE